MDDNAPPKPKPTHLCVALDGTLHVDGVPVPGVPVPDAGDAAQRLGDLPRAVLHLPVAHQLRVGVPYFWGCGLMGYRGYTVYI